MTVTRVWLVVLALATAAVSVVFAMSSAWLSSWSLGEVTLSQQLLDSLPALVPSAGFGLLAVVLAREALERRPSRSWLLLGLIPAVVVVTSLTTSAI